MVTIRLDYEPSAERRPRYGHGDPAHRLLVDLLQGHDKVFADNLLGLLEYRDDLLRIPQAAVGDSAEWRSRTFSGLDVAALYGFLRRLQPRRYVEIGSGNSTRVAATAKRDGGLATEIISVDPRGSAEIDRLCDRTVRQPLEAADLSLFAELAAGDVILFDGTHRVFTNSDVTVFFLEVLPSLASGITVAVHDIFLPEDYFPAWYERYYSEQYLLAAYLLAECPWLEIVLGASYCSRHDRLGRIMSPLWGMPEMSAVNPWGSSFWLRVKRSG